MRNLIREGSRQILLSAGLLARNRFILPSRPVCTGQWNREWLKRLCYLQLPVSPGFSPGSLLIIPAFGGMNRNKYVNEQYNTTKAEELLKKK
jgi:hypothetical protein